MTTLMNRVLLVAATLALGACAVVPTGPSVILCACGHAERMHERDAILGRGACHRGACGCSEYRPAA